MHQYTYEHWADIEAHSAALLSTAHQLSERVGGGGGGLPPAELLELASKAEALSKLLQHLASLQAF